MPKPKTHEEVKSAIEARGFELRSTYVNSKTKMDIWCPTCQALFQSIWNNFRKGHGCIKCAQRENGLRKRNSFSKVKSDFESKGWKLISGANDYKSNESKLKCICPSGHESQKRYYDLQSGKLCWKCKSEITSKKARLPINKAHNIAKNARLKLLTTDYKNVKDQVTFECIVCNFQFETTLDSVKFKGTGCPKCKCSDGERRLINYLENLTTSSDREYKFPHDPDNEYYGCKDKKDLPFDAVIHIDVYTDLAIEIDGIQHFQPVGMFGGEKAFKRQRRIDIKKSKYCGDNLISLLRISYQDLDNLEGYVNDVLKRINYEGHGFYYSNSSIYQPLRYELKKI